MTSKFAYVINGVDLEFIQRNQVVDDTFGMNPECCPASSLIMLKLIGIVRAKIAPSMIIFRWRS
jgi:hypothetical protein